MAIDETGLTKGLVRKLNALRKSVGDDLAEEVFARWLEREAASQARTKPDPVAMKIVEALAGFENDPKFNLENYGYTLRRAKGKGASGTQRNPEGNVADHRRPMPPSHARVDAISSHITGLRRGLTIWRAKAGEMLRDQPDDDLFIGLPAFLNHPLDDLEKSVGPLAHERLYSLISLFVVIKLVLIRVVTFVECVARFDEFFELEPRAANPPSHFDPDKHIKAWV